MTISKVRTLIDSTVLMLNCRISRNKKNRIISGKILSSFFLDTVSMTPYFKKLISANSLYIRNAALKTSMKTH